MVNDAIVDRILIENKRQHSFVKIESISLAYARKKKDIFHQGQ